MSEWKKTTWGELAVLEYGKSLRGYQNTDGPFQVFGTNGPIGSTTKPLYSGPSVVVGRKGAYRGIHYARDPFFVIDTAFYLKPKEGFDVRWAYYELLTQDINGLDSGSAIPSTSRDAFYSLPVHLPPHREQRTIAHILGTLDDKIELNRLMNETLEAMARAIFQSWFVDFEPVRAKASGESAASICQRLGLTPELLTLFPDSFEESEFGEIPTGWNYSTLAAVAKRYGGFIQTGPFGSQLHASDYVDEGVPVVMPQDLNNRRISVDRIVRVTDEMAQRLSRHRVKPGDVVYSRRGDVERHALVSDRETGWLCGTGCLLVRLGAEWPSQAYLSEVLDLPITREWLVRHAVGATMPNLNTSILGDVPLLMPSQQLLHAFEVVAGPFRNQQVASSVESDSLAYVRDALLPKLLNGEIGPDGPGFAGV